MAAPTDFPDAVVLVHGLWFPGISLELLRRRLARCGFDAHIFSYRTVADDFGTNAALLQRFLARFAPGRTVHLVGYSLGGLIVRGLFHYYPDQRPGRIVNLGTPHLGSHAATQLARFGLGKRILGLPIGELLRQVPQGWQRPAREVGIIAGDVSVGLGRLFPGLPMPNDGTVAVAETRLPGAADHVVLHVSHLGMLVSPAVARQTCHFLRSGRFDR